MRLCQYILLFFLLGFSFTAHCHLTNADTTQCLKLKQAGNKCVEMNQYVEALKYYTAAVEKAELTGNNKVYAECVSNIGMVNAAFRDYERAIFYFEKANKLALHNKYENLISLTAINLMAAYCSKGDPDNAEKYLHMLEQHPLSQSQKQYYYLIFNRGLIASCREQYPEAVECFRQSSFLEGKNTSPSVWYEMGNAFAGWGKTDSAMVSYSKAVDIAKQSNNYEETSQACKALSEIYKLTNQPDSAIKYQTLYINLQDSLFNINKFNLAKAQLFDYENNLIDRHINSLHGWIWLLVGIIILAVVILIIIMRLYRQLQSAQRLLVRKNEELIAQNERNKQLRADYLTTKRESMPQQPLSHNEIIDASHDETASEGVELPLTQEQRSLLAEQITEVMDRDDVIVDPDFNLNKLAKLVNSNSKYVSAIINDVFKKNFKTLLNEYRIREVCRRLSDDENYGQLTIAAIANTVGYNSMNNFITVFKRIVGMTPSKYRQLSLKERKT